MKFDWLYTRKGKMEQRQSVSAEEIPNNIPEEIKKLVDKFFALPGWKQVMVASVVIIGTYTSWRVISKFWKNRKEYADKLRSAREAWDKGNFQWSIFSSIVGIIFKTRAGKQK